MATVVSAHVESSTAPARAGDPPAGLRSTEVGTIAEIDTVHERLRVATNRATRERRMASTIHSYLTMAERIDEEIRAGKCVSRATRRAREEINFRIGELIYALDLLMSEHHAQIDGAIWHLDRARRCARVDAYVADRLVASEQEETW